MAIKSIKKIKTRGTVATIVCDTCFNEKEYDHCDHIYLNKPNRYLSTSYPLLSFTFTFFAVISLYFIFAPIYFEAFYSPHI